MRKDTTHLMWGFVPVRFCSNGSWEITVNGEVVKKVFTKLTMFLLKTNAIIEKMSGGSIIMCPRFKAVKPDNNGPKKDFSRQVM